MAACLGKKKNSLVHSFLAATYIYKDLIGCYLRAKIQNRVSTNQRSYTNLYNNREQRQ